MNPERITSVEQRAEAEPEVLFSVIDQAGRGEMFVHTELDSSVEILQYADYLAHILTGSESIDEELRVAYRAIHFIHYVTALHNGNRGMSYERLQSLPTNNTDLEAAQDFIRDISNKYVERCPTIMGYVDACMPEIDPSGQYEYLAETVAGLVGMQIEDELAAQTAADWDGFIPDDFEQA